MPDTRAITASDRMLLLEAAGERLALPLTDVSEIIRAPAVTRVPNSSPHLIGVANVRGTVLPVVALGGLLSLAPAARSPRTRVVVVKGKFAVGLLVDEVTALAGASDHRRLDLAQLLEKNFRSLGRIERQLVEPLSYAEAQLDDEAAAELVFVAFNLARQEYALRVGDIVHIGTVPGTVASLPRTDNAMIGIAAIDGAIVPLVSARVLLGLQDDSTRQPGGRMIIVRFGGGLLGLLVDGIRDIIRVSLRDLDAVPPVLTRGRGEAQVEAICRLEEGRRLISILSPAKLLDADTLARVLAHASAGENAMASEGSTGTHSEQFVVFKVGEETYGLPIGSVDEIVRCPKSLTRVPHAPKFVRGLMNLRGKAVAIIDQRQRFDLAGDEAGARRRIVVVTIDGLQAGFLVDSVSEILSVDERDLSPAPHLEADIFDTKVIDRIAMVERGGHMMLLIDPKALLDRAERDIVGSLTET